MFLLHTLFYENCMAYLVAMGGGWSGGAEVLGILPVPGRPTIWMIVGQGPIALAVGAGGDCLDKWSGGAEVLGILPVPGRPTIWMIVGQGPIALAVGAGGGCLDIFTLHYPFSYLSLNFISLV